MLINKIVVSDKFEHSDKGFKFFIGREKNDIIRLACIMLPQKSDYVKYFDYGGKNMNFKIGKEFIKCYTENFMKNR